MYLRSPFVHASVGLGAGADMFDEPTLAETVGLKHVIEDGVAVLSGQELAADRRDFVMRDLQTLLNQAIRGSCIASKATLFLGEDDKQAFGSFALIDRYLGAGQVGTWLNRAPNALKVIEQIQRSQVPDEAQKTIALEILTALLTQIITEPSFDLGARETVETR
jgi:hypothetical protein